MDVDKRNSMNLKRRKTRNGKKNTKRGTAIIAGVLDIQQETIGTEEQETELEKVEDQDTEEMSRRLEIMDRII